MRRIEEESRGIDMDITARRLEGVDRWWLREIGGKGRMWRGKYVEKKDKDTIIIDIGHSCKLN